MKIDIVYTWVDGSDPIWEEKRNKAALEAGKTISLNSNSAARFMDNDELLYSLRSIEKFAPWVNKIYIVTDNQTPKWLNLDHPKIKLVFHQDIFADSSYLPVFSARAIETQLHHIEGLSEHFIFFNDDMFLGNLTKASDFFNKDGFAKIFTSTKSEIKNENLFDRTLLKGKADNEHQHSIINSRNLILKKYNAKVRYELRHAVKPLNKSILFELEKTYKNDIDKTIRNKFRQKEDILIVHLFNFYMIAQKLSQASYLKLIRKKFYIHELPYLLNKENTYMYLNLSSKDIHLLFDRLLKFKPKFFCINQYTDSKESELNQMAQVLNDYFPNPSEFELKK